MTAISWLTGTTSSWATPAAWSTGTVPGASDDVTIAVAPKYVDTTYTVQVTSAESARSILLDQAAATLAVENAALTVSGNFVDTAGTLSLQNGSLQGGTYSGAQSTVNVSGSNSIDATWDGALNLVNTLDLGDGGNVSLGELVMHGANGTGIGTLTVGSQVTVNFNASGNKGTIANTSVFFTAGSDLFDSGALTVAGSATLSATGSVRLVSSGSTFINQGTIGVSNGGSLIIEAASVSNSGLISIGADNLLTIEATDSGSAGFSNTGSIAVAGGMLDLVFPLTTAQLANYSVSNGTLGLGGTLSNAGATLTTNADLANLVLDGATVNGGTIINSGHVSFGTQTALRPVYDVGTLSSVTFDGPLNLSMFDTLTVTGGLTLKGATGSGAGTAALSGSQEAVSEIIFAGSQTLDNATVSLNSGELVAGESLETAFTTLVLGPHLNLVSDNGFANLLVAHSGDSIVNDGTVLFQGNSSGEVQIANLTNNGAFTVSGLGVVYSGTLTNNGTLALGAIHPIGTVTNTGTMNGVSSGTFTNSGLVSGGALLVTGELVNSGTVSNAQVSVPVGDLVSSNSTFSSVEYFGALGLTAPGNTLTIESGLTFAEDGQYPARLLTVSGTNDSIIFAGSQSFYSAPIDLGSNSASSTALELIAGNAASPRTTLTLGSSLVSTQTILTQTGTYASMGGYAAGASIINDGLISASFASGTFSTNGLINNGTLAISNGDLVTGLASNAGTISDTGGTLGIGGSTKSVTMLNAAGAVIKGYGSLTAPILNDGVIEASGGRLVLNQLVSGTGTLLLENGANLNVASIGSGQIVDFAGRGLLGLGAPPQFLGTISGFVSGDMIDLARTAATSASFSGDSIVVTLTGGTTFALATASALVGSLTVTAGAAGDTLLQYSKAALKDAALSDSAAARITILNPGISGAGSDWVPLLHT